MCLSFQALSAKASNLYDLAGLLTYSPPAMPSHALYYAQWQFGLFMTVVQKRSLQQRDCSGLSPDSLFTHSETTVRLRTKSDAKVRTFF